MKIIILTVIVLFRTIFVIHAQASSELFDKTNMEYRGDKVTQAKLLLRKVAIWGQINEKEAKIDSSYIKLLNTEIGITKEQLKNYLKANEITEQEVGGNIDNMISFINHNGKKVYAKYFVIHDVSTPSFNKEFPENINDESWAYNDPDRWNRKITHTYLTRTGKYKTVISFSQGLRATKFELNVLGIASKGLFIHIELVQPRVYPPGNKVSAPVAPNPGFTDIQYEKLALLYICASARKGEWLVPAFHANIDEKINDGHDDPQNFEIDKFTNQIIKLTSLIKSN